MARFQIIIFFSFQELTYDDLRATLQINGDAELEEFIIDAIQAEAIKVCCGTIFVLCILRPLFLQSTLYTV
jgi:hypothetical protein